MTSSNPRAAAQALQARHAAIVATIQRALTGAKLAINERQDADDLLAALTLVLSGDGPAHEQLGYLLEGSVAASRLRRAAEMQA